MPPVIDQQSYNERSKNILEGAIAFWENLPEGHRLNEAFRSAKEDLPSNITKIFAFGLPSLPEFPNLKEPGASTKFEDLDKDQKHSFLLHAVVVSLKRTLKALTDVLVDLELHSVNYQQTTERFLKSRQFQVHASENSPELLDKLAGRIDGKTVVFAPMTDKYFKTYIKSKAREWPAAMVWSTTTDEGPDAETWCLGPPQRWCSVYDMVSKGYDEAFRAHDPYLGRYEMRIRKQNEGPAEGADTAGQSAGEAS